MGWYFAVLQKYAVFSGRARRKEFWMFMLFDIIIFIALIVIDGVLGLATPFLVSLYALATFLPWLGVMVRRLHDIDKSGWWILVGFIPAIGGLILLLFLVREGKSEGNRFGDDPKLAAA